MADIEVQRRGNTFRVIVRERSSSEHDVTVPADYVASLGLAEVDHEALVAESFRFLLEREPKESILRTFELSVIERYFPEYRDEIVRRLP